LERWFAVIEGAGVRLDLPGGTATLTPHEAPLRFDGAAAPACRLLDGPTRDLNLMHQGGRASMQRAEEETAWQTDAAQCGLFAAVPARWHGAAGRHAAVPTLTLLWLAQPPAGPMRYRAQPPSAGPLGWWLAFTPGEPAR